MSVFGNIKTDGMEQAKDTLGGGGGVIATNIYKATVVMAYVDTAQSGATLVSLEVSIDGSPYRENLYVTNRNGEAYYVKNNTKFPLPSFSHMNDICIVSTGKGLTEQDAETKVVMVYDYEAGKEVPRELPVLVDLIGAEVALAIQEIHENKQEKNERTGKYEPVNEKREVNKISKVFHPEYKVTVLEAMEEKDPVFWDKWLERNEGKPYVTFKEVAGSGRPVGGSSGSDSKPQTKSLFTKK